MLVRHLEHLHFQLPNQRNVKLAKVVAHLNTCEQNNRKDNRMFFFFFCFLLIFYKRDELYHDYNRIINLDSSRTYQTVIEGNVEHKKKQGKKKKGKNKIK